KRRGGEKRKREEDVHTEEKKREEAETGESTTTDESKSKKSKQLDDGSSHMLNQESNSAINPEEIDLGDLNDAEEVEGDADGQTDDNISLTEKPVPDAVFGL